MKPITAALLFFSLSALAVPVVVGKATAVVSAWNHFPAALLPALRKQADTDARVRCGGRATRTSDYLVSHREEAQGAFHRYEVRAQYVCGQLSQRTKHGPR